MGFIGDAIGTVTRPILGKPDPESQEAATQASANAANLSTQLAQQVWNETSPVRSSVLNRLTSFMQNGLDPTNSALYAPLKNQVENTYQTGRNNLMSQIANGGALYEGLSDLERSKSSSMGDLMAQILQDEYNKAYGIASGAPQQSTSALMGAGQTGSSLLSALSGQGIATAQGLNSAINLGAGLSKVPWGNIGSSIAKLFA